MGNTNVLPSDVGKTKASVLMHVTWSRWGTATLAMLMYATIGLVGCSERMVPTANLATNLDVVASPSPAVADAMSRMRPVAALVGMSQLPAVGSQVSGTYRWMADWPEAESIHRWEAAYSATRIRVVGRERTFVPPAGLRGVRLRYCIKPVTGEGGQHLVGHKSCSAWTRVDAPPGNAGLTLSLEQLRYECTATTAVCAFLTHISLGSRCA
jgi:hypothetical protein